jgi:hypothetical protein
MFSFTFAASGSARYFCSQVISAAECSAVYPRNGAVGEGSTAYAAVDKSMKQVASLRIVQIPHSKIKS